jgi:hypothetical protein
LGCAQDSSRFEEFFVQTLTFPDAILELSDYHILDIYCSIVQFEAFIDVGRFRSLYVVLRVDVVVDVELMDLWAGSELLSTWARASFVLE